MWVVVDQLEIVVREVKQVRHVRVQDHLRQRTGLARQLFARLVHVVQVEVNVSKRVHEFAGLQPHDLGDHHGQQGVRRDVEGDAEERVCASLVKLAV